MSTEQLSESRHFHLEQLADGVFAAMARPLTGSWCNAGIVDLGDRCLILDTFALPAAAAELKAAAEGVTGHPVGYVVNSHWHLEHYQGNQVFAGDAAILGTAATRRQILIGNPPRLERERVEYPRDLRELEEKLAGTPEGSDRDSLAQLVEGVREYIQALETMQVIAPNVTFERRLTLRGPGRTVELIEMGGGHSGSDAVMYLPEAKVLFTGDLLTVNQHPYCLDNGNTQDWIRAINEMLRLDANKVVPGHGPLATSQELLTVRSYLAEIQSVAADLARSGTPLTELEQMAVPERYAGWRAPKLYGANLRHLVEQLRR